MAGVINMKHWCNCARSKEFDEWLQLFLMKRGGEEIYVGPLGHHSSELIKYFEVQ
jgi:hypothetical protein